MRIDAHQHFWVLRERVGEWPTPDLQPIYRDFAPADLEPIARAAGFDGTVLVQTREHEDDTRYMLGLAATNPFIKGVVGWADLKAANAPARIAALAGDRRLKGLRPMLQDLPDAGWIDDPALGPAIQAMLDAGLAFDALVKPRNLPALLAFARRYPALRIVIDHGAKPDLAGGGTLQWQADMAALAALPHVHAKLSGLLTEAGSPPDLGRVADAGATVLRLFGPERVMFGSDWPVLLMAGDYARWAELAARITAGTLGEAALDAVFGGNAARFYRLGAPAS